MSIQEKTEQLLNLAFQGKTVKEIRYMTQEEANNIGWDSRPIVIFFGDGSFMFPQMDDEGNDGGALATSLEQLPTVGVI